MRPRRPTALWALIVASALSACAGGASSSSSGRSSGSRGGPSSSAGGSSSSAAGASSAAASPGPPQIGYEGVPLEPGPALGSPSRTGTSTVDGIRCGASEQLAYHIHAHLAVYVSARLYSLPAGIGIPGSTIQPTAQGPVAAGGQCIYWLHTHTADGVIHVESPTQRIYTLGSFFDEWRQPLTPTRVAGVTGRVSALLNGKPWTGSPRAIPLLPHAVIQLDVGQPAAAPQSVDWSRTGL